MNWHLLLICIINAVQVRVFNLQVGFRSNSMNVKLITRTRHGMNFSSLAIECDPETMRTSHEFDMVRDVSKSNPYLIIYQTHYLQFNRLH